MNISLETILRAVTTKENCNLKKCWFSGILTALNTSSEGPPSNFSDQEFVTFLFSGGPKQFLDELSDLGYRCFHYVIPIPER